MQQRITGFCLILFAFWTQRGVAGGEPWEEALPPEMTQNLQHLEEKVKCLESSALTRQELLAASNYWVKLSGQLNKAFIYIEDGDHHVPYTIDNAASPSQLRLESGRSFSQNTAIGTNIEVDVSTNPSNQVIVKVFPEGDRNLTIRKAELFVKDARFGKLSFGRGDTASYHTSVVDLSGTDFVINADVPLLLGNAHLRNDKVLFYSPTVRELFGDFDGLRQDDRIRYDFPEWRGMGLSTSVVNSNNYDAALRYAQEINGIKIAAATSYANQTLTRSSVRKAVLSGSFLTPHGLSVTLAGGHSKPSDRSAGNMLYAKIGFSFNLCLDFSRPEGRCLAQPFTGKTSFAIDVNKVNNANTKGDRLTAYGFAWVQDVPSLASELYVGWRLHELKSSNYPPAKDFRWLWGLMGGARVKF